MGLIRSALGSALGINDVMRSFNHEDFYFDEGQTSSNTNLNSTPIRYNNQDRICRGRYSHDDDRTLANSKSSVPSFEPPSYQASIEGSETISMPQPSFPTASNHISNQHSHSQAGFRPFAIIGNKTVSKSNQKKQDKAQGM